MLTLYPYQTAAIDAVRAAWKAGRKRAIVHLPTGCGKTITGLSLAHAALSRGHRVLWLAHRRELVRQPAEVARALIGPDQGVILASEDVCDRALTLASVQSLTSRNRLARYLSHGRPALVVADECHHAAADTWAAVVDACDAWTLGLTATPERTDERTLAQWSIAYSYPIDEAIRGGYLAPPRFERAPLLLDTGRIRLRGEDYDPESLSAELIRQGAIDHVVQSTLTLAHDRKILVFVPSVAMSTATAAALTAAGVAARHLDGTTGDAERTAILRALRTGEIRAVVNCAVLTEGYDDPTIDCVVYARPTTSKILYLQCVGRGLRRSPGKRDCLVIDITGACDAFPLVQAGTLLEGDYAAGQGQRRAARAKGEPDPDRPDTRSHGYTRRIVSQTYDWIYLHDVDRPVAALDCGQEGTACLIDDGDLCRPVLVRRSRVEPMAAGLVPHSLGMAIAEDFARQVKSKVARTKSKWKANRPSDKQLAMLRQFRSTVIPRTAGEAANAITSELVRRTLAKNDVIRRTDKP